MNTFQIISIAVFLIIAVVAVLVFAGVLPGVRAGIGGSKTVSLNLWGTIPKDLMDRFLSEFQKENKKIDIKYIRKQKENYETDLINALAAGEGPDLWLLPQDLILKQCS